MHLSFLHCFFGVIFVCLFGFGGGGVWGGGCLLAVFVVWGFFASKELFFSLSRNWEVLDCR